MFAIIISEKGGAERRESFDKNEINVGRVQGNDLMLPKGNVSKHHARLLFRDGRFIVTDLKSTNGTYVNGRKIAQATIVREGDKIYIGDFVLRLETNGAVAAEPENSTTDGQESIRTLARDAGVVAPPPPGAPPAAPVPAAGAPARAASPAVTLKAPTHPPGAPLPRPQPQNVSNAPSPAVTALGPSPMSPARAPEPPPAPVTPYGPLDDAEESAPPPPPPPKPRPASVAPPAPVASTSAPRPMTMPLNQMSPPIIGVRGATPAASVSPVAPAAAPAAPAPTPIAPANIAPPSVGRATAPPPRVPPKETPAQAGRRLALMTLLDRIADAIDLSPLATSPTVSDGLAQQIERGARDQAQAMRNEGDAPEGIDLDAIVRDAHRELVGLGPFGPLLEDEDVAEIHCTRFDQIFTLRANGVATEPTTFSSEEALRRVIARLAQQSGEPWSPHEAVIERRLPRAAFVAVAPPSAAGHVVTIRKRRRVETTLDELVRANALSKQMGQFLDACVAARANILVSGSAPLAVLSALATSAGAHGQRLAVVQDVEEIGVGSANAANLLLVDTKKHGEDCVRAAVKLRADRLIVTQLAGAVATATVDSLSEGHDGVFAGLSAPTLRQGLNRLVAQLVLQRPGLTLEGVRDVVGETFDIAIEVTSLPDGRLRVSRIAELGGVDAKGIVARDLYVWAADAGGGDGTFNATGVTPRIANELAARGVKLDAALFRRGGLK